MAQKSPKKMKWWKNSSLLFTGAVLLIPLAIFATTIAMVVKRSSYVRPISSPSQSPQMNQDFQFALDVDQYIKQGESLAVIGLTHTQNVAINSAAGRFQKALAAPKAELATWFKDYHIASSDGYPGRLALPAPQIIQLNASSDRQKANVIADYANQFRLNNTYNLGSPVLLKVESQITEAVRSLAAEVQPIAKGN